MKVYALFFDSGEGGNNVWYDHSSDHNSENNSDTDKNLAW